MRCNEHILTSSGSILKYISKYLKHVCRILQNFAARVGSGFGQGTALLQLRFQGFDQRTAQDLHIVQHVQVLASRRIRNVRIRKPGGSHDIAMTWPWHSQECQKFKEGSAPVNSPVKSPVLSHDVSYCILFLLFLTFLFTYSILFFCNSHIAIRVHFGSIGVIRHHAELNIAWQLVVMM